MFNNVIIIFLLFGLLSGCAKNMQVSPTAQVSNEGTTIAANVQEGDVVARDKYEYNSDTEKSQEEQLKVDFYANLVDVGNNTEENWFNYKVTNIGFVDVVIEEILLYCDGTVKGIDKSNNDKRLIPGEKLKPYAARFFIKNMDPDKVYEAINLDECKEYDEIKIKVITTRGNEFWGKLNQ